MSDLAPVPALAISAAGAVYEIDGQRFEVAGAAAAFADAVAQAHACHRRLRCLCQADGVEMYVARLAPPHGGYAVKRLPDTGWHHAPACPSYAPPAELSGLGQVLGSAIAEDPTTGETTLALDFALSKIAGRTSPTPSDTVTSSVSTTGIRLSLRGLLHYLWDEAELTRWHPGFCGKRSWGTVRRLLLAAAEHKRVGGDPLRLRLYIPEPFSLERREAINERRLAEWSRAVAQPKGPSPLMLLIAEVKEIVPSRYGYKAVLKHLPDHALMLDEHLYKRLGRSFEPDLALWASSADIRMVMIATFGLSGAGVASIHELCLMPVSMQWLPVGDGFGQQLIDKLVAEERVFTRSLPYNLRSREPLAFAVLSDCGADAVTLRLIYQPETGGRATSSRAQGDGSSGWTWRPEMEQLPRLPGPEVEVRRIGGTAA